MFYDRHTYEPKPISWLIVIIILLLLINFFYSIYSNDVYNDGVCLNCGGQYIYQQAIGHQYTTDYIYVCNKCGHLITVNKHYETK